jgi:hypothetical protein
LSVGCKKFDNGFKVECGFAFVHRGVLCTAVGEELFGECFGDECHWSVPCVSGPKRSGHKNPDRAGPLKDSNDSHLLSRANPIALSNGRDSRFGLARPVLACVGGIDSSARMQGEWGAG